MTEFVLDQLKNFSISPEFKEKWNEFQLYFIDLTENDARFGHHGFFKFLIFKFRIVLRGENAKLHERLIEYKNQIIEDLGEKNLWIVKACAQMNDFFMIKFAFLHKIISRPRLTG